MDNLDKNWQLINMLLCGYQKLEIADPQKMPKSIPHYTCQESVT